MQRDRAVRERDRVLGAGHRAQRGFELLDRRALREPVAAQDLDDGRDVVVVDGLMTVGDVDHEATGAAIFSSSTARRSSIDSHSSFVSLA